MQYTKLGHTGLEVSRICLGTMGFGQPGRWIHDWVIDEDASREVMRTALDAGINFFDTADVYSLGGSEEILGKHLKQMANRDEIVLATKVHGTMHEGPNGHGLSRKHIMSAIDASLTRLGTDYVDLYIIHRWDYDTPIEETMEALNDVVRSGKARYIGASAMFAWQFLEALHVSEKHGWSRFISMQNHYNLLYREEEREMLPLCRAKGIGVTPYSPLAAGRLARDWNSSSQRAESDVIAKQKYDSTQDTDRKIVDAVGLVAEQRSVPRAQVALAWLLSRDPVAAPLIGGTKPEHITSALPALELELTADECAALEEHYVPHQVVGAS
ncbi:aldo/keto reductase [Luteococcus sp. H138]|uniref:aldo/keto reductase n=1 Tax=unclassified Luteococcus TaxID=2639923 RepID=UPI00313ABF4A